MLTILTVFFNFDPILNFNNYIQNNILEVFLSNLISLLNLKPDKKFQ